MKPYTPPPRPKGSPPKAVDVPKPGPMSSVPTKALTGKMRLIINDGVS